MKRNILILLTFIILLSTSFLSAAASEVSSYFPPVRVDQSVEDEFIAEGFASYWINFESPITLSSAETKDWSAQGWSVYNQLRNSANTTQTRTINYLKDQNLSFQSFWIKNSILVDSSSAEVLKTLQSFNEIDSITARKTIQLHDPEKAKAVTDIRVNSIEPNISHIQADDVWAEGIDGSGIIVANIDTGVRFSHLALVNQYRGNNHDGSFSHDFNWFDPYGDFNYPADNNGHGTHTMGTMVGDDGASNQIGVAPGAQWIACRACSTSTCSDAAILSCGQFITAPTNLTGDNPNPDLRPNIVNNSWGDCSLGYDPWYKDVIDAWHAAGIYPVFSNGNASNCGYSSPPGLNTVVNPARYGNVTAVGSSGEQNGLYANHSNWGPTDNLDLINAVSGFSNIKPQVLAPGVSIRSSTTSGDTHYQEKSGTSMSAPHVAGLVALLWQAAPCLVGNYATTETIIEQTANDLYYEDGSPLTPTNFPNFATGWGEINALAAYQAISTYCSPATFNGHVNAMEQCDLNSAPLDFATVKLLQNHVLKYSTQTDENGFYTIQVAAGTYDLEIVHDGFVSQVLNGQTVSGGSSVSIDFHLRQNSPCIHMAPSSLIQTQRAGMITTKPLTLINSGAGDTFCSISAQPLDFPELAVSWMSVNPTAGTIIADDSLEIIVIFDSFGVSAGSYFANIKVSCDSGADLVIPVSLNVNPSWLLYLPINKQ